VYPTHNVRLPHVDAAAYIKVKMVQPWRKDWDRRGPYLNLHIELLRPLRLPVSGVLAPSYHAALQKAAPKPKPGAAAASASAAAGAASSAAGSALDAELPAVFSAELLSGPQG